MRTQLKEGTDEFNAIKQAWQEKAKKATIETLPAFLNELVSYHHDYGTICHAVAAAAIAAAWAMDHSPVGGITGFQSGAVMWEFIREWNYSGNKTGLRIIDYDNFLYPQYDDNFDKTISKRIWEGVVAEAQRKIEKADMEYAKYLLDAEQYKKDIAAFVEKYPDYYERREHYDHLGMGTKDQWDAEHAKVERGFEFAPRAPYETVNSNSPVYKHWQSICAGIVPFGYKVEAE